MDTSKIFLIGFIVIAIISLVVSLVFIFRTKTYISEDGTSFNNQEDLQAYEKLVAKLKPLFDVELNKKTSQLTLGLDNKFISMLKTGGFTDAKLLLRYRKEFITLNELFDQ